MYDLNYNQLVKLFSQDRINSYQECFPENETQPTKEAIATKYYENINYAQKLWKDICLIEVAIRNRLIEQLNCMIPNWFENKIPNYLEVVKNEGLANEENAEQYEENQFFINKALTKFYKECNEKETAPHKEIFISRQGLGFYSNIPNILNSMRTKKWNPDDYFNINGTELYNFRQLRNMIAHHENLLKVDKKLKNDRLFNQKRQKQLIKRLKNKIKKWVK